MDSAPTSPNSEGGRFYKVASTAEVKEGVLMCVSVLGKKMVLIRFKGTCYALDNRCTHAGGPLCQGKVRGGSIECPWHGAEYVLATGEAIKLPARLGVRIYTTRERDGNVEIQL